MVHYPYTYSNVLRQLRKTGWCPLVLRNWDAEKYGVFGFSEWAQVCSVCLCVCQCVL